MTRKIALQPSTIQEVITVLKAGGLVVFPSDTVYGLLVDAKNKAGVSKLLTFKDRPPGKAVSVFIPSFESISTYATLSKKNSQTLKQVLPGAFTIALPSKHVLDTRLESEKGTLGIRLPNYPPVQELVSQYGSPITATSANMAGRSPNHSIDSLLNQLSNVKKDMIDLIVDAGKLPRNKPSTVIDLSGDTIQTIRQGDAQLSSSETFSSISPEETQQIGKNILSSITLEKPLVIILTGDLGAGKTEMTRGIASHFNITNIISPTYVVYYEYEISPLVPSQKGKLDSNQFIHVDLYNIQEEDEFKELNLQSYLIPGNVMVIEWGEKVGPLYDQLKKYAQMIYVNIEHVNEKKREIEIRIQIYHVIPTNVEGSLDSARDDNAWILR
ncbi:MAG: L-threonylcarbamoyladenylate synthase [bacterium]|nr:L-threonylcarbamoyladenylate synthase [bacterium]